MSELNKLKVVDFTAGRLSSDDINTNIPFRDNLAKTRTIQQANAVIGAYVNRNYVDMQNKADKDEIPTKVSELENDEGYITTGDIPSKTSDLTNDGEDGEHPFITNQVNDLANYTDTQTMQDDFDSVWDELQGQNGEIGNIKTAIDFKTPKRVGDLVVDSIRSKNMFNKNSSLLGYYLNNTGEIGVANGYAVSNFIPVIPGEKYTYQGTTIGEEYGAKMGFYNSSKVWTNYRNIINGGETFTIPSGVYYIRTTIRVTELDIYQFEKGSVATPYSPYQELNGLSNPISLLDYIGITQGTEYTLNDDITNYKYIIVQLSTASNDANSSKQYIPVSLIKAYDNSNRVAISLFQSTTVYIFGDFYFSASNKIYCNTYTHASWNAQLKVWGIK